MLRFLFYRLDRLFIAVGQRHGVRLLRWAVGTVFLWFGALKLLGVSPVADLVGNTYFFLPQGTFLFTLGTWEAAIGLGLLFQFALRFTLGLLWLQMAGVFVSLMLQPEIFFRGGNPFLLTLEGEFVIKNIVIVAAGIVMGGFSVKPK